MCPHGHDARRWLRKMELQLLLRAVLNERENYSEVRQKLQYDLLKLVASCMHPMWLINMECSLGGG